MAGSEPERASIGRKKRPASASLTRRPTDRPTVCPMGGREEGAFLCIIEEEDEEGTKGGNTLIGKAAIATVIAIHNNALLREAGREGKGNVRGEEGETMGRDF